MVNYLLNLLYKNFSKILLILGNRPVVVEITFVSFSQGFQEILNILVYDKGQNVCSKNLTGISCSPTDVLYSLRCCILLVK